MFSFLAGYKTYIVAALGIVATGLHSSGKIDDNTYQLLIGVLTSSGVATVAAKINRIQQTVANNPPVIVNANPLNPVPINPALTPSPTPTGIKP